MAKDSRTPDDATENREVNQPKDTALPTVSSRGIMAMQGEPELAESAPSAPSDAKPESFEDHRLVRLSGWTETRRAVQDS